MTDLVTAIEARVKQAARRMWWEAWLRLVMIGTAAGLAGAALAVLALPTFWPNGPAAVRWWIVGAATGVGVVSATVVAVIRTPARQSAALEIDHRFDLRERITTCLSLRPEEMTSPAGLALIGDAIDHLKRVDLAERFPVRAPKNTVLVPCAAGVLALAIVFGRPIGSPVGGRPKTDRAIAAAEKAEIEKKLADLRPKPRDPLAPADRPKSEDLKRLEARLEEIARQPRDTTRQLRERIQDLTPLEEEIKKLERERSEKARLLQQQLQSKDQLQPNQQNAKGPAGSMQKALADADLDTAKAEAEKLAKMLQKDELTEQQKDDLAKQLGDLSRKLEELAEQKDKEQQLRKLFEEGKLDAEALKRELQQLKSDNEKLRELKELAQKMADAQMCLKNGDCNQAAQALGEAASQLGDMLSESGELDDLRDQLQRLQSAKNSMCQACDGDGDGECLGGGQGESSGNRGQSGSQRSGRQDMANGAGVASGLRPEDEQRGIKTFDARQNAQFNAKGQKIFENFVPGRAYKKKSTAEIAGEIQQAAQAAPEAIEVQRIPKAARDMARGYFRNLGGQAADAPPAKADPK